MATLDAADVRLVQRVMLRTADGGALTDRAAKRLIDAFTRAGLWPLAKDLPVKPQLQPGPLLNPPISPELQSATILEFKPSQTPKRVVSSEVAAAMAELVEFKGRLH